MAQQPVSYFQTDPRWKNIPYAVKGESSTIGGSGCGPSSAAMILATWADKNVTPKTECAWALKNGYKALNSGTYYSYFVPAFKRYGLKCTQLNSANIYGNSTTSYHAQAKTAVDNGDLVIACMGKGNWTRSGHYIVVWKISGNTIFINDPASTKLARTQGDYSLFKKQVKYYWVIKNPGTAPKVEDKITNVNYDVIIKSDDGYLNCRKGAGTNYNIVKKYYNDTIVHISKTSSTGWGYTGEGWIHLNYTKKYTKPIEEDEDMTLDKFKELMNAYLEDLAADEHVESYSEKAREWAESKKYIKGDSQGRKMYRKPLTREEFVTVLYRILNGEEKI